MRNHTIQQFPRLIIDEEEEEEVTRSGEEIQNLYDALCRQSSKSSFLEKCPTIIPTPCRPETRRRRGRNSVSSTDLRTLALLSAYTPIYGPRARTTNHRLHRRFSKTKTKILVTYAIFRSPFSGIALQQDFAIIARGRRRRRREKKEISLENKYPRVGFARINDDFSKSLLEIFQQMMPLSIRPLKPFHSLKRVNQEVTRVSTLCDYY